MKKMLLATVAALALPLGAAHAEPLVFDHVTLVDGNGGPAQPDMTVAVDNGVFTVVTPTIAATKVAGKHIDARGKYLMPA